MHERTLEQDSLDKFEQKTLATIAALLHLNAVSHGFWDCETCDGRESIAVSEVVAPTQTLTADPDPFYVTCPTCKGKRYHRNFGESIALIISEYSEALEAARKPDLDNVCDKCDGEGAVPPADTCAKCGGTGENICGSRVLEELLDGLIRGLETASKVADDLGLDLGKAFAAKHRYNLTRPHKHGKEF